MLVDKERQDSSEPDGELSEREGLEDGKESRFQYRQSQPSPGSAAASCDLGPIIEALQVPSSTAVK